MRRRIKNTPSHIFFLITKKDTLEQFSLKQHRLFRKTIVIFVLIIKPYCLYIWRKLKTRLIAVHF